MRKNKTMQLNRRLFLRGLGGVSLAVPFLGSVAERAAKAQGLPVLAAPKRLIVMFTHNGCLTNRWFPENSHGALGATDYAATTLAPLAPFADKLLMPRGIRAMNEWTTDASLGQGNDFHTQVVGTYFTCVPITPHTADPFDLSHESKFEAKPTAPSLDHICARQVNPNGLPLFLRVSDRTDHPGSAISYSASEQQFMGIGKLGDAFGSLTGLFQSGVISPDDYRFMRGQSLMDLVKDDLESLERLEMSAADKQKLTAWKELLISTSPALRAVECSAEMATALGLTQANVDAVDTPGTDISEKVTDTLDKADLFSNVAALSALCDLSRVIFLKYPASYVYRALGLDQDNDILAHRIGGPGIGGPCASNVNQKILTIDQYYAEKFAHLVGTLDEIDEGEGTLLDNCAAVWFQESSDGCAFNLNNMPIIQAGACGGYFKTGQAINVDDGSSDLHRGNSEALCAVEGSSFASSDFKLFGTPVEFGNAPINKYYCNLMNAIGVRADISGFPAVGGTEEVTHYGMYDDTTDFTSGGANPPMINSPGGFEELKA